MGVARKVAIAVLISVVGIGIGLRLDSAGRRDAACGKSCDGKDPQIHRVKLGSEKTTTCGADARTVRVARAVELRYSAYCRTAWAKHTGTSAERALGFVVVESINPDGLPRMSIFNGSGNTEYTMMVDVLNTESRACYQLADEPSGQESHPPGSSCTDLF